MNRRKFLASLGAGAVFLAQKKIPLVSQVATKVAEKCGWIRITINGETRFIPFWS